MKKYYKAAVLKEKIGTIRSDYTTKLEAKDEADRQLAVCMYLIDRLALRVGNEKDTKEEADTVGCCSLRVEHMQFKDNNMIELDFLGKDSMRYHDTVPVMDKVYQNLQKFCKGKKPEHDVFHRVKPQKLNDHLKSLMPGLTAKVFRTYNASVTLENELFNIEKKSRF